MPSIDVHAADAPVLADPVIPHPYRVVEISRETEDTFTLALEPGDGDGLRPFAPGQFSMLYVFGAGEMPISISGDPAQTQRLVYTVSSGSEATHTLISCRPGDWIGVRGPFGSSWPIAQARGMDVLIAAGGIGLAPLRPLIYHVLRHRDDFVRLIILYGEHTSRDRLFHKELSSWSRMPDTQVLRMADCGSIHGSRGADGVKDLLRHLRLHPDRTIAMIGGPQTMMRDVLTELQEKGGMEPHNIYVSMERQMKCGAGLCGGCQYGPYFVCRDGPVFCYDRLNQCVERREV